MDQTQRSHNISTMNRQAANRSRTPLAEDELDDIYPTRMPSSARRYRSDVNTEAGRARADAHSVMLAKNDSQIPSRKNAIPPRRTRGDGRGLFSPQWRSASSASADYISSPGLHLVALALDCVCRHCYAHYAGRLAGFQFAVKLVAGDER